MLFVEVTVVRIRGFGRGAAFLAAFLFAAFLAGVRLIAGAGSGAISGFASSESGAGWLAIWIADGSAARCGSLWFTSLGTTLRGGLAF